MRRILIVASILIIIVAYTNCGVKDDERKRDALNEAGIEYGLEFEGPYGKAQLPDMPEGTVMVIDADERERSTTEVYFDDNSFITREP